MEPGTSKAAAARSRWEMAFGHPLIEVYFDGRFALELEAEGEAAFQALRSVRLPRGAYHSGVAAAEEVLAALGKNRDR